jgi:hypothetical protein
MPQTEEIKGSCEHCGFAFQGTIESPFPSIKCPKCGKETENYDAASEVDERDKEEHYGLTYEKVKKFETVK